MTQHKSINANRNLLPDKWWQDEMFREEVHAKIKRMHNQGISNQEIARRTGVSDRNVLRIVHKHFPPSDFRCGVQRVPLHRGFCRTKVPNEGDRCTAHMHS